MLSVRVPDRVYPATEDIIDIDLGAEIEEYNYDGRTAYRGNLDPEYSDDMLSVYWLYDDASRRIGVVEHTSEEDFTVYWHRDNVFATLLQEDWVPQDKTVWSLMTQEAYEDCMRNGWNTIESLRCRTGLTIVTPADILQKQLRPPSCLYCGRSGSSCTPRTTRTRVDPYSTLFVDEECVLYTPPSTSRLFGSSEKPGSEPKQLGTGQ